MERWKRVRREGRKEEGRERWREDRREGGKEGKEQLSEWNRGENRIYEASLN